MTRVVFLAALSAVLLTSRSSPAQSAADCARAADSSAPSVKIFVTDASGARVPEASVTVTCGNLKQEATTSADGAAALRLPAGRYRVEVKRSGFESALQELHVDAAGPQELTIALTVARLRDSVTVADQHEPARRSAAATKTDTPLAETPQAVTVVTSGMIEERGATNLQDALNYAAGVRSDAFGLDSRTDSILVRGGYPDEYLDGMRQLFNWYTSTTRVDPYQLERIEVLRGPSSMLYGQGTTAGIVNLVSKQPLAAPRREIGLQFGSYGRKQLQADFGGPLSKDARWRYRLVGIARDADTQVDHVRDNRALVAPAIAWVPSDATSLTLQGRWQQDRSGSTLQFFPWNGSATALPNPNGDIPTETFIGEPAFDHYDSDRLTGGWLFEHRMGGRFVLRQNLRLLKNEVDYRSLYSDSFSNPGHAYLDADQRRLGRYAWASVPRVNMLTADQHLEGRLQTGAVHHQFLLGADVARFTQRAESAFDAPESQGGGVPSIDVYAPVYSGYTLGSLSAEPKSTQDHAGAYLQDQMKLGSWIAVLGVRHDRAQNGLEGSETENSRATSTRAGVMHVSGGWSPYLSYSESFTPLPGTNLSGERFDPMRGRQMEAGLKVESASGYTFTVAAFDLREENRLVSDPANPLDQVQAGKTKTRGLELEASGRLGAHLSLTGHYNYIENDEQLDGLPKHEASVWSSYRFAIAGTDGFSTSLGVRYFSAFQDGVAPRVPALALADVALAWTTARWRYALNASNLMDEAYVSTCLPRGDCFYGARRTINATVDYRF